MISNIAMLILFCGSVKVNISWVGFGKRVSFVSSVASFVGVKAQNLRKKEIANQGACTDVFVGIAQSRNRDSPWPRMSAVVDAIKQHFAAIFAIFVFKCVHCTTVIGNNIWNSRYYGGRGTIVFSDPPIYRRRHRRNPDCAIVIDEWVGCTVKVHKRNRISGRTGILKGR